MLTCEGNENYKKNTTTFRPIEGGGEYNKGLYWEIDDEKSKDYCKADTT